MNYVDLYCYSNYTDAQIVPVMPTKALLKLNPGEYASKGFDKYLHPCDHHLNQDMQDFHHPPNSPSIPFPTFPEPVGQSNH